MAEDFYRQVTEPFTPLELMARQVVEGFITGLHKSPFHGFSVEFAEHRQYNEGESIRHIDWKLYGRTDRLYVKRFQEETNLRCHILVDTSSSMYYPFKDGEGRGKICDNKLSFSICAAACLSVLLVRQRDAVGLRFFNDGDAFTSEVKSNPVHLKYLLSEMERRLENARRRDKSALNRKADIAQTLHLAAEQIHKRSLIILFSDMFANTGEHGSGGANARGSGSENAYGSAQGSGGANARGSGGANAHGSGSASGSERLFDALQHLRYHNNEVILFHVTDRSREENLDLGDRRHYCLVDMETGKEVKLSPVEFKQAYRQRYEAYKKELQNRCNQYKIDFVEADINEGFVPVLQAYLVKRQKIFK